MYKIEPHCLSSQSMDSYYALQITLHLWGEGVSEASRAYARTRGPDNPFKNQAYLETY